ncbi:hypothetical protein TNCV_3149211 [Trichonephila clavipes]|nr:hypothetical protein TNCV_3149211 [Trichonephila clavipes]
MEWRHTSSPVKDKAKQTLSKRKIMATMYRDRHGVLNNDKLWCQLQNSTEAPKSIVKQTAGHAVKRCFAPPRESLVSQGVSCVSRSLLCLKEPLVSQGVSWVSSCLLCIKISHILRSLLCFMVSQGVSRCLVSPVSFMSQGVACASRRLNVSLSASRRLKVIYLASQSIYCFSRHLLRLKVSVVSQVVSYVSSASKCLMSQVSHASRCLMCQVSPMC